MKKFDNTYLTYDGSQKNVTKVGAFIALVGVQPVVEICTEKYGSSETNNTVNAKFQKCFEEMEIPPEKRGLIMLDNASYNSKYFQDH